MEKAGILHSKHDRLLLFKRKSEVIFVYIFLVIFFIAAMLLSDRFMMERNLRNLIISNIGLLFVAYGQLFIVLLGGVDLSVGSVISLTNVICVTMITENPSTWFLAFIASLAAGAGVGLVNGLLVVRGRLQPIIATLATQTFFAGVALYIMPGPEGILPSELCKFITKGWNYLFPLFLTLIVSTVVWLLLNRSRFGRAVLAVGGNEQSAKSSGISVGTVKIRSFIFTSLMAVMAGLFISAYATPGSPLIGEAYSQRSITAAVVGGAALAGGKGSVVGCIAAAGILGIVNNLLNLRGVSSYYQYVLQGVILILALAISAVRTNKK